MTKSIEITAKKVDDAIKKGLEELGATLDEVEVVVLDAGGFLKKAKVRLTLERDDPSEKPTEKAKAEVQPESKPVMKSEPAKKPEKQVEKKTKASADKVKPEKAKAETKPPVAEDKEIRKSAVADGDAAEKALEFVKNIVAKMGFDSAVVTMSDNGELMNVSAPDGDDSLIIGRHGETLSALSYLAETAARSEKNRINVIVDCNGYRDRRAASLTAMAKRRADECASKRRKIRLEPMERIDRRTVHNALTGDSRVSTASEGKEPKRYVVIIPKN